MGVEPARVGQHPHDRAGQILRLTPEAGSRAIERDAKSSNPHDRDRTRAKSSHPPFEPAPASAEFIKRELRGRGRRSRYQIRDAATAVEQRLRLPWVQTPRRESGRVQRWPESVAGTREMVPGRSGIEPRIDAAEEHVEASGDDVADGRAFRGTQRRRRRAHPEGRRRTFRSA